MGHKNVKKIKEQKLKDSKLPKVDGFLKKLTILGILPS